MLVPILQALYDPACRLPKDEESYHAALSEAELFILSSQLYQLLKNSGREQEVPAFFRGALQAKYNQGMFQNVFVKNKENELLTRLEAEGVEVIPLKGVRFSERYYGHMAGRLTSDIDLFIREEELQRAISCVENAGYKFEIVKDHHARLHQGDFSVELHWTLDKPHWSEIRTAPFWRNARSVEGCAHVMELSLLDTFYFICLHGVRHQLDNPRYVLDIAQILFTRGEELDMEELLARARADKTSKRVRVALSVAYRLFPLLQERKPLPFQPEEGHWDYQMIQAARRGVKGREYYRYKLFFKYFLFDEMKYQLRSLRRAY